MQNRNSRRCYMCRERATSKEHVPPKAIFPERKDATKDYRKNLIKVPSCYKHNSGKCDDDFYLNIVLSSSFGSNNTGQKHWDTKIERSIARSPKSVLKHLRSPKPVVLVMPDGSKVNSGSFEVDSLRLNKIWDRIGRGLIFHVDGVRCPYRSISLHSMNRQLAGVAPTQTNARLEKAMSFIDDKFRDQERLGENPEVFNYSILREEGGQYAVYMVFFGGHRVLATYSKNNGKTLLLK